MNNKNKNKTQNKKQQRQARKKQVKQTRVKLSCFSRFGPIPPIGALEGKANIISSQGIFNVSDYPKPPNTTSYKTILAITTSGHGNGIGYIWNWNTDESTTALETKITTPYLNDPSITQSRALKSTMMVENITPARLRKPGLYVLRTSQRFATDFYPTPTQLDGIETAVKSHPDTKMMDCHDLGEICNIPLTEVDYPYYRGDERLKEAILDHGGTDYRRPMTTIWVVFPYKVFDTPTELEPNQDYRFSIFTQQRTRHNMSSVLASVAKLPPQVNSSKKLVDAVREAH